VKFNFTTRTNHRWNSTPSSDTGQQELGIKLTNLVFHRNEQKYIFGWCAQYEPPANLA
jgi:hypothetical protein